MHALKRYSGNHLHQRRVLGIQAEIVMLKRHVSGKDVIALVPRKRLLPNRIQQLAFENRKQHEDSNAPHPALAEKCLQSGKGSRNRTNLGDHSISTKRIKKKEKQPALTMTTEL